MNKKLTNGDRIFNTVNTLAILLLTILILYPLLFVVNASLSNPQEIFNSPFFGLRDLRLQDTRGFLKTRISGLVLKMRRFILYWAPL